MVIYKYHVDVDDGIYEVKMSVDSEILHVQTMNGNPNRVYFWATHYPERDAMASRFFVVVGTGQPVPGNFLHKGTAVALPFVWHLMEVINT